MTSAEARFRCGLRGNEGFSPTETSSNPAKIKFVHRSVVPCRPVNRTSSRDTPRLAIHHFRPGAAILQQLLLIQQSRGLYPFETG
jgi:hypothetical protein